MNYINYIFQIFRDYSGLQWQWPKLLSIKKKKNCIWILAISDPSRVLCMGSKFPFRETTLGRVWDSGLGYVRKPICKLL